MIKKICVNLFNLRHLRANNARTNKPATWSGTYTGAMFGTALFLPAAGYRSEINGTLTNRGTYGYFWSSRESSASNAYNMYLNSYSTSSTSDDRRRGFSVRCIAE